MIKEDIDSRQLLYPGETLTEEELFNSALRYGIKVPQKPKNPNQ
jgi:hypothetical protein